MKRKLISKPFYHLEELAYFAEQNMLWVNNLLITILKPNDGGYLLLYWQMVKEEENEG